MENELDTEDIIDALSELTDEELKEVRAAVIEESAAREAAEDGEFADEDEDEEDFDE